MTIPLPPDGAVPGRIYKVEVSRRLRNQSYQSRFENAMRLRARRAALKEDSPTTYDELREARANGVSWSDIRLAQIERASLQASYAAGEDIGDRGRIFQEMVALLGLPRSMGYYHYLFGGVYT